MRRKGKRNCKGVAPKESLLVGLRCYGCWMGELRRPPAADLGSPSLGAGAELPWHRAALGGITAHRHNCSCCPRSWVTLALARRRADAQAGSRSPTLVQKPGVDLPAHERGRS